MSLIRAVLLWCLLVAGATADERILSYHSDISVRADGSMFVTETISVRAEGERIRRGIYRDFPTDYKDGLGNRVSVTFELLEVQRDGRREPHHTERRSNGLRIYAGSTDVFLDPGIYEYALRYRVDRMLGYFAAHDELYWNVTGNGWEFPIEQASASVALPETVPAQSIHIEGYTGAFGSSEQAYQSGVGPGGEAQIRTTRALAPREGLTLVVTWPKGHVDTPTLLETLAHLLRQNLGLLVTLLAGLGSLIYLFLAWRKAGMDPPPGVIFPHYEPPDGFSPASIRYIHKMGYDKRTLTAAVLNLAVKGFVTIARHRKDYTLTRTDKPADDTLAPGEAALLGRLFSSGRQVALKNDNHSIIGGAMNAHKAALKRDYYRRYFNTNRPLLLPSLVLMGGALLAIVMLGQLSAAVIIVFVVSAFIIALFAWLLQAPTLLGRRLMDKIDGFRMYLQVAEKDDLNLRNPPEKTPQLFEAYLPYALALGVEQPWAEQFEEVFRRLRDQDGHDYRPAWYAGRWQSSNPVRMASALGGSLSTAISSASTPPGSSSGSGGGGFSGGGGGGGGGGGW